MFQSLNNKSKNADTFFWSQHLGEFCDGPSIKKGIKIEDVPGREMQVGPAGWESVSFGWISASSCWTKLLGFGFFKICVSPFKVRVFKERGNNFWYHQLQRDQLYLVSSALSLICEIMMLLKCVTKLLFSREIITIPLTSAGCVRACVCQQRNSTRWI